MKSNITSTCSSWNGIRKESNFK